MTTDQTPTPPRVRVTSPRAGAGSRRTPRAVTTEIDAQTELGEVFLRSLMRAQLRLAAGVLAVIAVGVGGLPLLFRLAPELSAGPILGMPFAWGVLGFLVYPVLVALGWVYVRRAEANERTFVDMVGEPDGSPGDRGGSP